MPAEAGTNTFVAVTEKLITRQLAKYRSIDQFLRACVQLAIDYDECITRSVIGRL